MILLALFIAATSGKDNQNLGDLIVSSMGKLAQMLNRIVAHLENPVEDQSETLAKIVCDPPCQNGGSCTISTAMCKCTPGYIGPSCEIIDCIDYDGSCSYWAGNGECETNPDYMLVNCKVSCGVCGG